MSRFSPPDMRFGPRSSAPFWCSIGLVLAAVVFFVLDVFYLGLPLLGLLVSGVLIGVFAIAALVKWLRRNRSGAIRAGLRALIFLVCSASAFLACQYGVGVGSANAQAVAEAIRAYHDKAGQYPESLADLVPEYLESIPRAGIRWSRNEFRYNRAPEGPPELTWSIHGLMGRADYDFERDRVLFDD